jgi:plasmid stability protein
MAAVSIRDLDDGVRERLRMRAARHGRSMEAEIRAILADAVSEPGEASGTVVDWVRAQAPQTLVTTSISVAEIRYGVARLPTGRRRDLLGAAADEVFATIADAVLAFDADAARIYADVVVERERAGSPISGFDAQIAAVCRSIGAAIATRNTDDFRDLSLEIVDPWTSP